MRSAEVAEALARNRELADALGVRATPSFVIGSELVSGALEPAVLRTLIDKATPAKQARNSAFRGQRSPHNVRYSQEGTMRPKTARKSTYNRGHLPQQFFVSFPRAPLSPLRRKPISPECRERRARLESAPNGAVWVIGTGKVSGSDDYNIFRWAGTQWQLLSGAGVLIAVDPNGNALVVNSRGGIFRYTFAGNPPWEQLPPTAANIAAGSTRTATDVAVGGNGSLWIVGVAQPARPDQPLYRWTNGAWEQTPGAGVQITVAPDGSPWVVNSENELWVRDIVQKTWKQESLKLRAIAIGPTGATFGVRYGSCRGRNYHRSAEHQRRLVQPLHPRSGRGRGADRRAVGTPGLRRDLPRAILPSAADIGRGADGGHYS